MTAIGTQAHWRKAGLYFAVLLLGTALGTMLTIPVLALAGAVVRIPGVHPVLDRILTADYDAPLMWGLLVSSWLLGIVVTYAIATFLLKWRDAGPRS